MEKRKYILDTDIGGDCDDCAAVAMMAKWHREGKIDLLGVLSISAHHSAVGAGLRVRIRSPAAPALARHSR